MGGLLHDGGVMWEGCCMMEVGGLLSDVDIKWEG